MMHMEHMEHLKELLLGVLGIRYMRVQKQVDLRGPGNRIYFIPGMSCEATRDTIHLSIECTM